MREGVAFALLACACGAALHQAAPTGGSPGPEAVPTPAPSVSNAEAMAAFDSLAARRQALVPGMREVARKESDGERVEIARAEKRDACVRVAFESSSPVIAKLVD